MAKRLDSTPGFAWSPSMRIHMSVDGCGNQCCLPCKTPLSSIVVYQSDLGHSQCTIVSSIGNAIHWLCVSISTSHLECSTASVNTKVVLLAGSQQQGKSSQPYVAQLKNREHQSLQSLYGCITVISNTVSIGIVLEPDTSNVIRSLLTTPVNADLIFPPPGCRHTIASVSKTYQEIILEVEFL